VLNERGRFGAKMFSHYTDIVIFVLGYFIPTRRAWEYESTVYMGLHGIRLASEHAEIKWGAGQ